MKVVVTVGMPGSGKSSHAKFIGDKYGFPLLETHTPLYDELKKRGLSGTVDNIKKVTIELKKISDSYLTERLIEIVKRDYGDKKLVFLSGLRAWSEIEILRKEFGDNDVFVVAFLASRKARFQRVVKPKKGFDFVGKSTRESEKKLKEKREEETLMKNLKEFIKKDEKDLGWGLAKVMALADYFIVTESEKYPYKSWEATDEEFEEIVKEILK